jgi:hypothetical protein
VACSQKPPAPHGGIRPAPRGAGGGWHPAQRRERRREEKIARSVAGCQPLLLRRVGRAGKHAPAQTRAWAHTHGRRACERAGGRGVIPLLSARGRLIKPALPARAKVGISWGAPRRAFARTRRGGVHPISALNTPSDKAARVFQAAKFGLSSPLPAGSPGRLPCLWRDPLRVPQNTHNSSSTFADPYICLNQILIINRPKLGAAWCIIDP